MATMERVRVQSDSTVIGGRTLLRATVSSGYEIWAATTEWRHGDLVWRSSEAREKALAIAVEALEAKLLADVKISNAWRSDRELREMFGGDDEGH